MRPTFRNPTVICFFLFLALVTGKSIIRELMEPRQFLPDRNGNTIHRPGRQLEEFPVENCRVTQKKPDLSAALNQLCAECYQTYRVANFFVQCRARCFDNDIIRGCAMAMFSSDLMTEFDGFIDTDVKVHGMTVAPVEKTGAEVILQQLQKQERNGQ